MTDPMLTRRLLVVSGLSAVAIAGPILDLYGRHPEVFVINRASPASMILFGLVIGLTVPLLAYAVMWVTARVSPQFLKAVYVTVVAGLSVAVGLVVARQLPGTGLATTLLAVALVTGLVWMAHKWAYGFLVWSALALPLVVVLFLTTSPASALIWSAEGDVEGVGVISAPHNIVMLQLDEMPLASIMSLDGGINADLFPNFARLADEGTWYRNALADSIATSLAVPSVMTGARVERGPSPTALDHPNNLFTMLGNDYMMHVIEWVATLCPESFCSDYAGRAPAQFNSMLTDAGVVYLHLTMPEPVRHSLPSIGNAWSGFLGQDPTDEGEEAEIEEIPVPEGDSRADWIDWMELVIAGIDDYDRPLFSYAHLEAPHVPWFTNPSGTHYTRPERHSEVEGVGGDGRWVDSPGAARVGFQRHLYQIGLLDVLLGRLIDRLEETGTWDETMVIVVADHGASFEPGQHRRWPEDDNRDDLYRIPMFVKYPSQAAGRVVDEPVFTVDLAPTIVDVMGVETTWQFDGISLLDVDGLQRPHRPIWWCCSRDGVSTNLSVLFGQVERNHRMIPDQSSWTGVAGVGGHAALIRRSIQDLEVVSIPGLAWEIGLGADLADDDRPAGIVQTYVNGRLELPDGIEATEALIVVNGRVAGMVWLVRDSPTGASFNGILAEELIEEGPNHIDVLVPGPDGVWYRGTSGDLSVTLADHIGRELRIEPEGSRRLQVDLIEWDETGWTLVGWAADIASKTTPTTIYIYAGEDLLAYGEPNRANRNVVAWFRSDDLLMSGFRMTVPVARIPDGLERLTVVAEWSDGRAVADAAHLPTIEAED